MVSCWTQGVRRPLEQLSAILEGTDINIKGLVVTVQAMKPEGEKKAALPLHVDIKSMWGLRLTLRPL